MQTLQLDAKINDLAGRTCSVVHARDLRSLGIGRNAIARRVDVGSMSVVLPRTYAVGPSCQAPTFDMQCMAGVLAGGPGSAVDGETAGALLGVWDRSDGTVHVTVPGRGPDVAPPPFEFHRSPASLGSQDRSRVGAIPVVAFVDMCVRMARSLSKWQLASVIERGLHARLVTLDVLVGAVDARRQWPWITVLRDAITLIRTGSAGTRSGAEDVLLDDLMEAGSPEPIVNTRGALGLSRDEPDFYWPDRRLNVEVDGRHHDSPGQAADDQARDAGVEAMSICVVRVRARDVWRRRRRVVRLLMAAIAGEPVAVDQRRYLRLR